MPRCLVCGRYDAFVWKGMSLCNAGCIQEQMTEEEAEAFELAKEPIKKSTGGYYKQNTEEEKKAIIENQKKMYEIIGTHLVGDE